MPTARPSRGCIQPGGDCADHARTRHLPGNRDNGRATASANARLPTTIRPQGSPYASPSLYPRADPHDTANLAQRDPRRLERCGPSARPAPARDRPRLAARRRGGPAERGGCRGACAAGGGYAVSALCGAAARSALGGDHAGGRGPGPRLLREHRDGPCPTHTRPATEPEVLAVRRRALCAASRARAAPSRVAGGAVPGGEAGRSDVDPRTLGAGAGRARAVAAAEGRARWQPRGLEALGATLDEASKEGDGETVVLGLGGVNTTRAWSPALSQ